MRRWRMRTGRPTAELVVTGEERETLERWARRDALEHARDGREGRAEPEHGEPDLAGVCAATTPGRRLQTVQGPAVCREGPRHRGALPRPTRQGPGALRGREDPDSSA